MEFSSFKSWKMNCFDACLLSREALLRVLQSCFQRLISLHWRKSCFASQVEVAAPSTNRQNSYTHMKSQNIPSRLHGRCSVVRCLPCWLGNACLLQCVQLLSTGYWNAATLMQPEQSQILWCCLHQNGQIQVLSSCIYQIGEGLRHCDAHVFPSSLSDLVIWRS